MYSKIYFLCVSFSNLFQPGCVIHITIYKIIDVSIEKFLKWKLFDKQRKNEKEKKRWNIFSFVLLVQAHTYTNMYTYSFPSFILTLLCLPDELERTYVGEALLHPFLFWFYPFIPYTTLHHLKQEDVEKNHLDFRGLQKPLHCFFNPLFFLVTYIYLYALC